MDEDLVRRPPRCVADRRNQRSVVTRDVVADLTGAATQCSQVTSTPSVRSAKSSSSGPATSDERLAARGGQQNLECRPTAGNRPRRRTKRCQGRVLARPVAARADEPHGFPGCARSDHGPASPRRRGRRSRWRAHAPPGRSDGPCGCAEPVAGLTRAAAQFIGVETVGNLGPVRHEHDLDVHVGVPVGGHLVASAHRRRTRRTRHRRGTRA